MIFQFVWYNCVLVCVIVAKVEIHYRRFLLVVFKVFLNLFRFVNCRLKYDNIYNFF